MLAAMLRLVSLISISKRISISKSKFERGDKEAIMGRSLRLVLTAVALTAGTAADAGDRLTVQLMWVTQAQFAGYYVAKDGGFYKDVNLDVRVKAGAPEISTEKMLQQAVPTSLSTGWRWRSSPARAGSRPSST
jgi:hypothetical protein